MKKRMRLLYGILLFIVLFLAGKSFLGKNINICQDVLVEFQGEHAEQREIGWAFKLKRGLYQVSITYEADSTNHFITACSGKNPKDVRCDRILLERAKSYESFQVWVSNDVDDFQVIGDYAGTGQWSVSQITIHQRILGKIRDLFYMLMFWSAFVLVSEAVLCGRLKQRTSITALAGVFLITLLASVPLFGEGLYIGHDTGFHLNRIEGVWQGLASGQFPVRIQPNWLHDYGYAVSIFYGDILLYIPAFLRLIGFSVQEAYEWFVFLVNAATTAVSYFCWKKMFESRKIALFTSFLYTLSLYRLVNVYTRAAVGEYCAMIFLPVVVYGFWCILGQTEEGHKKNWYPLMIGFTGLLQTHMLSCEIVGIFSVFLCLICIRRVLLPENFLALVKAAVSTVILNLWYLVPFFDYMIKENLKINTEVLLGAGIQRNGMLIKQLFEVSIGVQIAVFLMCYVLIKYKKEHDMRRLLFLVTGMGLLALFGGTVYFPWDTLIRFGLGFLASIQFPWRLLGSATVLFCTGIGAALWIMRKNMKPAAVMLCMGVVLVSSILSSGYMLSAFMESAETENCYEQRDAPYYVSGGEYLPADVSFNEEAFHMQSPAGLAMQIEEYEKRYNRVKVVCENQSNKDGVLQIPILLYRGYQAFDVLTKETFPMLRTESGMTGIVLPSGYRGTVCVEFREPFFWRISEIASALGVLFLLVKKRFKCWRIFI